MAIREHRGGFDLDQQIVAHEPRDLDQRAGRAMRAEVFLPHGVDLLAVTDVAEEDRHLAHVGERGAGRGQAALDVLVHLTRLGDDVVAADGLAVLVAGDAARDEHDVPGAHDVREVADRLGHAGDADLLPVRLSHAPSAC
jgi:hypothetical protein